MKLRQWMHENRIGVRAFARKIGTGHAVISAIAIGRRSPSLGLALLIERETGGAVRPIDMIPEERIGPYRRKPAA